MPSSGPAQGSSSQAREEYADLESFVSRKVPYTTIPDPLPQDRTSQSSPLHDLYFYDSATQDQVSVMEACLHNLHDVYRAKQVFEQVRGTNKVSGLLEVGTYNAFLDAYLEMATTRDVSKRSLWLEDTCALYEEMESDRSTVKPNAHTYATMFRLYHRFNSDASSMMDLPTPNDLLRAMVRREISVSLVVADRSMKTSQDAEDIFKILSKSAVEMNISKAVTELGVVHGMASSSVDPLKDVPEAIPVLRQKVSILSTL